MIDDKMQIFMEFVKSKPMQSVGLGSLFTQEWFNTCVQDFGTSFSPRLVDHAFEYLVSSGFIKKNQVIKLSNKQSYSLEANVCRLLQYISNPERIMGIESSPEDYRD